LGYSLVPWLEQRGPKARNVLVQRFPGADAVFPILACYRQELAEDPLVAAALACAPSIS
jgi:hypothetical protein